MNAADAKINSANTKQLLRSGKENVINGTCTL